MIKRTEKKQMKSYLLILLIHVLKIHAQKKYVAGWENSIRTSVKYINRLKDNSIPFDLELADLWEEALIHASIEIDGGCTVNHVESLVDKELIILHCLTLINL